jgi:hypothetical protein
VLIIDRKNKKTMTAKNALEIMTILIKSALTKRNNIFPINFITFLNLSIYAPNDII